MKAKVIITNISSDSLSTVTNYLSSYFDDSSYSMTAEYNTSSMLVLERDDKELSFYRMHIVGPLGGENFCDVEIVDLNTNKIIHQYSRENRETIVDIDDSDTWVDYTEDKKEVEKEEENPKFDFEKDSIVFESANDEQVIQFTELLTEKLNSLNNLMTLEPKRGDLVRAFNCEWSWNWDESKPFKEQLILYNKFCMENDYHFTGRYYVSTVSDVRGDYVDLNRAGRHKKYMTEVLDPETMEPKNIDFELIQVSALELKEFCLKNKYYELDEYFEELLGGVNADES